MRVHEDVLRQHGKQQQQCTVITLKTIQGQVHYLDVFFYKAIVMFTGSQRKISKQIFKGHEQTPCLY